MMIEHVDPNSIEAIVGAKRHNTLHLGRAISSNQTVFILHSRSCKETVDDLFTCVYSIKGDDAFGLT